MKAARHVRINRIAKKIAKRAVKLQLKKGARPMRHRERRARLLPMIAYDLETTRIQSNETPRPLYLTAYGADWRASLRVASLPQLAEILCARFLIPEFNRARFVAWNGNNFDVYLVAAALLAYPKYVIRPYLTRSKNLRGLRVTQAGALDAKGKELSWEFLDGISMTGLVGKTLADFLKVFAPEFQKLAGPDFSKRDFNVNNPQDVAYAERDSEGLYRGLQYAESIVLEKFGVGLQPTIGNLGIKIFQSKMPQEVTVWAPAFNVLTPLREQVMRGGFCYRARKFDGPIWKYDINQAYAAAMRDARLPCGRCLWSPYRLNKYAGVFIVRCSGENSRNRVPFYYRGMDRAAGTALTALPETWLTSIEWNQLLKEGWKLTAYESFFWDEHFSMKDFVTELETLRMSAADGPAGALGTMLKMIGNNAYGKTVEQLDGLELVMALDCPEGFSLYQAEDDQLQHVWYKFGAPVLREYHQPQLGAFITAHVRMEMRRGILRNPDAWLYADTDCLAFSEAVDLPIHASKYGLWKIEEAGADYWIINKKVYAKKSGTWDRGHARHAKGMNVNRLGRAEFKAWFDGCPPSQVQVQRQNFVKFVTGTAMFAERTKVGEVLKPGLL